MFFYFLFFLSLEKTHLPSNGAEGLIVLHQHLLTHADGPRSHFIPTSSTYARESLIAWGFLKGSLLSFNRLLHENNEKWLYPEVEDPALGKVKWDPVPPLR